MKLNVDCLRDILLSVEDKSLGESMDTDDLGKLLPDYSEDDLIYCTLKLYEAGFLEVSVVEYIGSTSPGIKSIGELTFMGHEFLENIRPETVWKKTKHTAAKIGSYSINTLTDISAKVIAELIKSSI